MTIKEFLKIKKITCENVDEKIKDLSRTFSGCLGQGVDYQCSSKGLELNSLLSKHSDCSRMFYTWDEVREEVLQENQVTFW